MSENWLRYAKVCLIVSMLVSLIGAAGCGSAATPTRTVVPTVVPQKTATSLPTGPVSGGELVFGYTESAASFDPPAEEVRITARVMINVCEPLVVRGPDRNFQPALAESWTVSPDGKTYTFALRKGVKFHDGTPFNAEAVKFNLDRVANPENKLLAIDLLGAYEATEVVDDYTVRVRLKEPLAPMLDSLSQVYMCMVSPTAVKKWGASFGEHVVGTGPFMVEEIVTQSYVKLVKNPDYNWAPAFFKHQGPAYLDRITFKFIPEETTRLATLETGETSMVDYLGPEGVKALQGNPKFYMGRAPYGGMPRCVWLNTQVWPTDNLAVRRALSYAVNKQEVVDTLFKGINDPATAPLTKSTFGYNPGVNLYPFSQAKVDEVMVADGWKLNAKGIWEKDGKPIHLVYVNLGGYGLDELAQMVQGQLIKAGFDVEIITQALSPWMATVGEGKTHNLVPTMSDATDPTVLRGSFSEATIDTMGNRSKVRGNAELETLLLQQDSESDPAKREQLVKQIQVIIMDQAYVVPMYDVSEVYGISAKVQDVSFEPATHPLLYDAWIKP